MEAENSFRAGDVEARGRLCVECLAAVAAGAGLLDRCGAVLCRACAGEFYVACSGCGGLVARDEALARPGDEAGALSCFECFGRGEEGGEAPTEGEVAALVAEYVALHEETKRLGARLDEVKDLLKRAARARPRVSNAVVLRAGDGAAAGVRCSYAVRTSYDAEKLSAAEQLMGAELFSTLFERKVSYAARRDGLEAFLSSADEQAAAAREAIRAAEQRSEVETVTVVAQRKKK